MHHVRLLCIAGKLNTFQGFLFIVLLNSVEQSFEPICFVSLTHFQSWYRSKFDICDIMHIGAATEIGEKSRYLYDCTKTAYATPSIP